MAIFTVSKHFIIFDCYAAESGIQEQEIIIGDGEKE